MGGSRGGGFRYYNSTVREGFVGKVKAEEGRELKIAVAADVHLVNKETTLDRYSALEAHVISASRKMLAK